MKKRLCIGILILFVLLTSCQQNLSSDIFSRIEDCMEAHPDSALSLLHQIPHPERLSGKQSADYALLLTQARDKNFLDSLQSDSLIKIAADYYRDSKDDVKAGKSLFYYGKVMALQDNDTLAMRAYLDAQNRLENTREYKTLGLIQEYMGRLNNDRGFPQAALCNYQQSANFYLKEKDTLGVVYNYRNIARIYDIKKSSDSAVKYLELGLSFLKEDTTVSVLPSLLQLKGIVETKKGDFSNAANSFITAIKYEKNSHAIPYYYFSLGNVYIQMGYLDRAEECFKQGVSNERVYTQANAYRNLYLLEKQRVNKAKALFYKEKADSLFDIYRNEKSSEEIIAIQQRDEKDKFMIETELIKQKEQKQIYLWMMLFILLLTFCCISYPRIKKIYVYKKRLEKYTAKARETIERNEQVIEQLSSQVEDLEQHDQQMQEETKIQIAELSQQILSLQDENQKIGEMKGGIFILEELKAYKLIVPRMDSTEFASLFEYIDLTLNNFATRLKKEYNLNETTLMFAVCIRLGFSKEQLMTIFEYEQENVYKKKSRLKKTFSLTCNEELETFLTLYSSNLSS